MRVYLSVNRESSLHLKTIKKHDILLSTDLGLASALSTP